jgi:acetyl esterase/lipase
MRVNRHYLLCNKKQLRRKVFVAIRKSSLVLWLFPPLDSQMRSPFLLFSLLLTFFNPSTQAVTFTELMTPEPAPVPVVYKKIGETELKLWYFAPTPATADKPRAAIVLIHGGAWVAGSADVFFAQARYFASRGLPAFSLDYRLLKADGPAITDCFADCKSAMRYLRVHAAQWGIDPQRIAVLGDSAGGHLAAALGVCEGFDDPSDDLKISAVPNAMILCNPIVDMTEGSWIKFVIAGKALEKKAPPEAMIPNEVQLKLAKQLSPLFSVRPGLAPTLLMHGLDDHVVLPEQAKKFAAAMTAAQNRCDLDLIEGARHAFILTKYTATEDMVVRVVRKADDFLVSLGFLQGAPSLEVSPTPAWETKAKK